MGKDFGFYATVSLMVLFSAGLVVFANVSEPVRIFLALPAVSGLTSMIVQAWRDRRAHERAIELQQSQNQFTLGIASEMAHVAFVKHVEFAEEYAAKVNGSITKLFHDGPTPDAIYHFQELRDLRKKYTVWLSSEIDSKLLPFEEALLRIGTDAQLVEMIDDETRIPYIKEMFAKLERVLSSKVEEVDSEGEAAIIILKHLREILSIDKLTKLRIAAINAATSQITEKPSSR